MKNKTTVRCELSERDVPPRDAVPADTIPDGVADLILREYPAWKRGGYICRDVLARYRTAYVRDVLGVERGELSALDQEVVRSLAEQELLTENLNAAFESRLTFGKRAADRVANYAGSWRFISAFAGVLILWIIANSLYLVWRPFDPYPFILLNLILSCLAAIQAPIIMMSQNRLEAKDRLRAEYDYKVNLKAELEIRNLHEKVDHLVKRQWERLLEIQQIQIDLMDELTRKAPPKPGARRRRKTPPRKP
ncbi:MAG TPA: DUF1003 domain-containing protein [bacterium]|nr:DUF1003 domain-containing protein [bacterium]